MTKKRKNPTPVETSHTSTIAQEKPHYRYDEYFDFFTLKMKPANEAFINKLAEDLVDWATHDPDALKLTQFYGIKGIRNEDFGRWMSWNDKLREAHARALMLIGNRREIGALKGKLNPGMVSYTMPRYDKAWKKLAEWRASLKAQSETQDTIKVQIENVPSSPLVPEKKKNENEV